MEAPLIVTQDGTMFADFLMDNAPAGFEDCMQTSYFLRRLNNGTAYAELGEPSTDHLSGDPVATLRRVVCIDDKSVCAHIEVNNMDTTGDWIRAYFKPTGPRADALRELLLINPGGLKAKFRFTEAHDDDDNLKVINIYGIDVIQN